MSSIARKSMAFISWICFVFELDCHYTTISSWDRQECTSSHQRVCKDLFQMDDCSIQKQKQGTIGGTPSRGTPLVEMYLFQVILLQHDQQSSLFFFVIFNQWYMHICCIPYPLVYHEMRMFQTMVYFGNVLVVSFFCVCWWLLCCNSKSDRSDFLARTLVGNTRLVQIINNNIKKWPNVLKIKLCSNYHSRGETK